MSKRPKKWPDYALDRLEGTLLHLKTIEEVSRRVQVAAKAGDAMGVLILAGDIRERTQNAVHLLVQARTGEYNDEHSTTTSITGGSATNHTAKGV